MNLSKLARQLTKTKFQSHRIANDGFTMLELLMVMGIIGVVAGFVLVTFPAAQDRARDANRKSDLKQYQTSLEVYANRNNGFYPRRSDAAGQPAGSTLCGDLGFSSGDCPLDPKDGQNECDGNMCRYLYQTDSCGAAGDPCAAQYVLWGALERPETSSAYWVVCSNGISGESTSTPTGGNCPL